MFYLESILSRYQNSWYPKVFFFSPKPYQFMTIFFQCDFCDFYGSRVKINDTIGFVSKKLVYIGTYFVVAICWFQNLTFDLSLTWP